MGDLTQLKQIDALLDEALDLSTARQREFVARICKDRPEIGAQLKSLLSIKDDSDDFLEGTLSVMAGYDTGTLPVNDATPQDLIGRNIGPWRIIEEIGHGGMGRVFLAERADGRFQRKVAFKLIKAVTDDMGVLERFHQERRILGQLQHPNIAQLLDSGVTEEGWPYFIMELIEGSDMMAYCDDHRLGLRERLRLFLDVCDAVRYAHQRLVIHRDLKANNIMITKEGQVKLLDFGIAKVLKPESLGMEKRETQAGQHFFTPECASPEQLMGEPVTTASDVFALGSLLHFLLTGRSHLRSSNRLDRMVLNALLHEETPAPSSLVMEPVEGPKSKRKEPKELAALRGENPASLRRKLSGDLDAIVLRCLRKQASDRYSSVFSLMEDVRACLESYPVKARDGGTAYRMGLYLKRNKASVATAAILLLMLCTIAFQQVKHSRNLQVERDIARQEAAKAGQVASFLKDIFTAANPFGEKAENVTTRDLLRRGVVEIRKELADQPEVQAELLALMAESLESLGAELEAKALYEEADELRGKAASDALSP